MQRHDLCGTMQSLTLGPVLQMLTRLQRRHPGAHTESIFSWLREWVRRSSRDTTLQYPALSLLYVQGSRWLLDHG